MALRGRTWTLAMLLVAVVSESVCVSGHAVMFHWWLGWRVWRCCALGRTGVLSDNHAGENAPQVRVNVW